MKKAAELNQIFKELAKETGLALSTIKRAYLKANHGGNFETWLNKAKTNSTKRIYGQDLIIPNNAMLLQLLKHNWHRHSEEMSYSTYLCTKDIELKRDWYREKLRVVSSTIDNGDNPKYLFSGLTIDDLYIISGTFTIIQKTPIETNYSSYGKFYKIPIKQLFKLLNSSGRWDKLSSAYKKDFIIKVAQTLDKCNKIQADYWLNHKLVINSIETQDVNYAGTVTNDGPTEDSKGLIFKRVVFSPDKDGYLVQLNKNGLLNQAVKQNRLVTINKDWLQFGRNTSNHAAIKFYLAYRIELAANAHNEMRAEISIKHMDYELGKTDKAFVRKYLQYLKNIRALKDFTISRSKITWTMRRAEKIFDLIQVRDEDKEQIELPKTAEIIELEKRLSAVNAFNGKHAVTLGKHAILNTRLHAVFSRGSFDKGGRFYTDGDNGFQGVKSEEREKILIDGKKTVELDFSAYHPHLIYALRGLQTNTDPYGFHPCRDAAKRAFNIMLNAKDRNAAIGAFKNEWGETISADHIFNLCREAHKAIADLFCSDSGITLQNIDSKIALEIVEAMQRKKAVCLPMHDSFIVAADRAEELRQTMQEIYHRHTGSDCPIK